jgi:hypothetical protein
MDSGYPTGETGFVRRLWFVALALALALLPFLVGCGTTVPDVRGMTEAQAAQALEAAGLRVGEVVQAEPATGTPGPVVAQVPAAGQTASRRSLVKLTLASLLPSAPVSAQPRGPVPVPRVKDKTATAAKWRLEMAGFKVKVKWVRHSGPRGRVVSQSPSGGTARPGSTVVVKVSTGGQARVAERADSPVSSVAGSSDDAAGAAFQNHLSGIRLTGEGVVTRVLSDDNDGSRHQRFILRLASGQTLLIAHNIDIAPRVASLEPGDTVAFNGIYEWNPEGGTVHWTHHDPSGQHPAGWLKHNGSTYQ